MSRPLAALSLSLVAAGASAALAFAARAQEAPPRLDWQIDRGQSWSQITLSYRTEHHSSNDSHPLDLSTLLGVTAAQLDAPTLTLVHFQMHRDAGDFDCEGSAHAGHAAGSCDFRGNAAFASLLKSRGIGTADASDLFQLAYADVGTGFIDELAREKYPTPSIDDLRKAGMHGVNLAFLRDMDSAGYRADSLSGLVRMRDHGISSRYVAALKDAGYGRLTAEEAVRARDHGVSGFFLTSLAGVGYKNLPMDALVRLRDHGVTADFVARANTEAGGGQQLTPDELIRLHDTGALYSRASARTHEHDRDRDH